MSTEGGEGVVRVTEGAQSHFPSPQIARQFAHQTASCLGHRISYRFIKIQLQPGLIPIAKPKNNVMGQWASICRYRNILCRWVSLNCRITSLNFNTQEMCLVVMYLTLSVNFDLVNFYLSVISTAQLRLCS